jgi:hypothetical protein
MNKYYTSIKSKDGFGAQYQRIIQTYIYCKLHSLNFAYTPLEFIEHNYDNDQNYINKIEELINLKSKLQNIDNSMIVEELDFGSIVMKYTEENIDLCNENNHMQFIKECFWENKERNHFKNNKMNIAVHIRRPNSHDTRIEGANTPNSYYLNIMNEIREKYKDSPLQFHIYSQGVIEKFKELEKEDVEFHLDEEITKTFVGLVAADILVLSPSSFSYVAGLLSDGIVYYKPFWHNKKRDWVA